MKKIFSKEVIIGLLVLVALAVLFIGIDFLKGINVLQKENTYYVSFENVQGLAVSAPVTVNGYKVGQVREIAYEYDNPGHIRVDIDIDDDLKLPEGSVAVLESDLLGTASIALRLGTSSSMIAAGSELPGEIPSGMMDKVSKDLLPAVSDVFPKVDSLLANINTLVTGVNTLVTSSAINNSLAQIETLTANLVKTSQQLNALLATMPAITTDVKHITGNFAKTSDDINTLAHNLSEVPLDKLVATLQTTIENLNAITDELNKSLNSGDSTLGKLMNDPALYDNLNNSVRSLDSLFIDIKANPKRYINIKLL